MNGAVGTVKDIVYEEPEGPRGNHLPAYVVVDFHNCLIKDGNQWKKSHAKTCVPIPTITEPCEKTCCSIKTCPLRICKAITIHKGQGINVGKGKEWECAIAYFVKGKVEEQQV